MEEGEGEVASDRLVVRVWYHKPRSLRPRSSLQLGTESLIERVFPESQSARTIRHIASGRGRCRIPGRRFCSGKDRPLTSFLCPPERTVRNSTCCPGKGMLDSHRNNASLETLGTSETGATACLRWAVGNREMHVGGSSSLKTDGEGFKGNARPHQHGFVVLSVIVATPPCMWPIQSHESSHAGFHVTIEKSRSCANTDQKNLTSTPRPLHEKCQSLRKPQRPLPRSHSSHWV